MSRGHGVPSSLRITKKGMPRASSSSSMRSGSGRGMPGDPYRARYSEYSVPAIALEERRRRVQSEDEPVHLWGFAAVVPTCVDGPRVARRPPDIFWALLTSRSGAPMAPRRIASRRGRQMSTSPRGVPSVLEDAEPGEPVPAHLVEDGIGALEEAHRLLPVTCGHDQMIIEAGDPLPHCSDR